MTRRLVAIGLVLLGLVGGIAGTELVYRVGRRFTCVPASPLMYEPRSWGWGHRPGVTVENHGCIGRDFEYRTSVTINSLGLRDREIPYERHAGTRRVLLLGDSITQAAQVPLERTFAKLAEARLQAEGIEVVNAAVAGFGTDSQLLFYRDYARRYAPDLVVLVFNLHNDIYENLDALYRRANERAGVRRPPKPSFRLDTDGALQPVPAPTPERAPGWWRWTTERLYLARLIDRARAAPPPAPDAGIGPVGFDGYAPWTPEWSDAWRLTARLIVELREAVQAGGARFAVVVMPAKEMADPAWFEGMLTWFRIPPQAWDLDRTRRAMLALLREEGIDHLDLMPALYQRGGFFRWDVHLNDIGHAAVAPPVADFVRKELDAGT